MRELFQTSHSFLDLNWLYHDRQAAVIVEFLNQHHSQQALMTINTNHPDIDIMNVTDMRIILNHSQSSSKHSPRYNDFPQHSPINLDESDHNEDNTDYLEYSYRLSHVPLSINHKDITYNLSYYGQIELIQKVTQLPSTKREIIVTFDKHARINLLDHIWAVNVHGHNISLAKVHLTDLQLAYHKNHVTGFKGFNYKTMKSQALRLLRPYGRMTCYFHQNIAYIAFKTEEQMHSVCQLRLFTDDDRLLSGRPRVFRTSDLSDSLPMPFTLHTPKAMSRQTTAMPDLNSNSQLKQRTTLNQRPSRFIRNNGQAYPCPSRSRSIQRDQ